VLSTVRNICVIGLGSMGMGAAQSCIRAGLNTWGADLNPMALETLRQAGARDAQPAAHDFAAELDAVLLLVVNAQQVRAILFGDNGLAASLKPGTVVMISSTISAADAQAFAQQLAEHQLVMLDAPVSGGAAKAAAGDMTVMASGSDLAFEKLKPVLDAVAGKVHGVALFGQATVQIVRGFFFVFDNQNAHDPASVCGRQCRCGRWSWWV